MCVLVDIDFAQVHHVQSWSLTGDSFTLRLLEKRAPRDVKGQKTKAGFKRKEKKIIYAVELAC